jgi:ABC-type uncharacterized transport system substrate-binding protein
VLHAIKRLALGLCLIAAASAVLLVADRGRRTRTGGVFRVAILKHADTPVLDDGVRGTLDALAARGYRDGDRLALSQFNAQGDIATGIAIARQVTAGGYDLVISSSTPSLQAVANNNRDGHVRHVFTLVADPFSAGVGLDRAAPLKHPPDMVGQGSMPAVEQAFVIARRMLPGLQRVGVPWNPAESNSVVAMTVAREVAARLHITLLEANVDNSSAVSEAVNSLLSRDAQAILISADNTVISAVGTVIAVAARQNVPVFSVLPGVPDRGTLFDVGPNFYEVGRLGGDLVADVLEGADMTAIPIRDVLDVVPTFLSVNTTAVRNLRERWRVPPDLVATADVFVDESGVHRKAAASVRPLSRTWKVSLVQLSRLVEVEDAERGVRDGFKEAGLVADRDYVVTTRDAQGDMATVSGILDGALAGGSDLLLTFSTPVLQAALQKTHTLPIVFTYVADPIAAGAGRSLTEHLGNVTGSFLISDYSQMIPVIRAVLPGAKTIGTVYVPAEANMVSQLDLMTRAMAASGITVKAVAANSAAEVGDAAFALAAGGVDAICQLPGNLTAAAFPSISQVARRARVPVFGFQSNQASSGAVAVAARDYYDSGREAAALAARVMRGESPATMPFVGVAKTRLMVNVAAAQAIGLTLPASLVARADAVLGR